MQWNSPKNGSKTGTSWTPQPLAATTGAGYKPMNQAMTSPQPMMQQPMFPPQMQPMMVISMIWEDVWKSKSYVFLGNATNGLKCNYVPSKNGYGSRCTSGHYHESHGSTAIPPF